MSDKAHNVEKPLQAVACIEANESKEIQVIQAALDRLHQGYQKSNTDLIEARNQSARLKSQAVELKAEASALAQEKLSLEQRISLLEAEHKQALNELQDRLSDEQAKAKSAEAKLDKQIQLAQAEKANEQSQLDSLQQQLTAKTAELATLQEQQAGELQQVKLAKEALKAQLEEKNKELAKQVKDNHDLNLQLLEKDNRFNAFRSQADKRIAELTEASHTVEQMRKMLGGFQAPTATENTPSSETTPAIESTHVHQPVAAAPQQSTEDMEESFEQWLNPSGARQKAQFNLMD
jgi:chromosome segregation ATPase